MKHEGIDNKWDYNKGVVTGDTCQREEGTYLLDLHSTERSDD